MTIEQVIARIERAKSIYENAIGSDIVKGRVAMCNDIIDTLRLEAKFHPKQEQQELPKGLEDGKIADIIQNLFPADQFIESESLLLDRNEAIFFASHFYELGCRRTAEMYDEIEYNRQRAEEAENKEFEEELHLYWLEQKQKGVIVDGSIDDYITVQEVARHFAEWGAEHLKK